MNPDDPVINVKSESRAGNKIKTIVSACRNTETVLNKHRQHNVREIALKVVTNKGIVVRVGDGNIIRLFDKTPTPRKNTDVICPHFCELAWAHGCPGACAWCLRGDTLILMGTNRWTPINHLHEGDEVAGLESFHGSHRLVKTKIISMRKRIGEAYKMLIGDEQIVCSYDHRWLGRDRESDCPHWLKMPQTKELAFLGKAELAEPDIDYQRGYVYGVSYGDGCWDEDKSYYYQLVMHDKEALERTKLYIKNLTGVDLLERIHDSGPGVLGNSVRYISMVLKRGIENVAKITSLFDMVNVNRSFMRGFIAGFYDAEGSCSRNVIRMSQKNEDILWIIQAFLENLTFDSVIEHRKGNGTSDIRVRDKALRFFANIDPAIERKQKTMNFKMHYEKFDGCELIGKEELYDIQTGTGNFIADGLISHNCYLQGTFRWESYKTKDHSVPPKLKSREEIEKAVTAFLDAPNLKPHLFNSGELADSLMMERGRQPFSEFIMSFFKGTPHKVLFLTKMTDVQHFLENKWQKNAILAWSINATVVASRYEKRMPSPTERIAAAGQVYDAGYQVRVRLDPMVPVPDWPKHYGDIIECVCDMFKPERVTLGTLRGLASTIAAAKDKEWVKYLTESSNWGRKPSLETRLAMYEFAIKQFRSHGIRKIAVCKDTKQVWTVLNKKFGLNYHEMTCNCLL